MCLTSDSMSLDQEMGVFRTNVTASSKLFFPSEKFSSPANSKIMQFAVTVETTGKTDECALAGMYVQLKVTNMRDKVLFSTCKHVSCDPSVRSYEILLHELEETEFEAAYRRVLQDDFMKLNTTVIQTLGMKSKNVAEVATLSEEVENMFHSMEGRDVTILVEDKQIEAHKFVLMSRSEAIRKMLATKDTSCFRVIGFSHAVFAQVVTFMYTDEIGAHEPVSADLLIAAIQYKVKGLEKLCLDRMKRSVDVDMAMKIVKALKEFKEVRLLAIRDDALELVMKNIKLVPESDLNVLYGIPRIASLSLKNLRIN